jgi:hypothetical protein
MSPREANGAVKSDHTLQQISAALREANSAVATTPYAFLNEKGSPQLTRDNPYTVGSRIVFKSNPVSLTRVNGCGIINVLTDAG